MISTGEFRNGVTIEYEIEIYTVIEFQHVKLERCSFCKNQIKKSKNRYNHRKTFRLQKKCPKLILKERYAIFVF